MAFHNRVRLPFKLTRAQFPEERSSFRKANGEVKTLSVVIRKTYQGETDYFPERWHQRLKIALGHDEIIYEGDKYVGLIASEGEYTIEWVEFLDYPTAKAQFSVQVTPFDATNSNCQTCDEAMQLSLEDDTYPDPLNEGMQYNLDIVANDAICCYPAVFSVTSINSDYVDNYFIDQNTGELTTLLKSPILTANGINLLTYRVTCPNGSYDEASVFADVVGSEVGCLAPTSLTVILAEQDEITYTWSAPSPVPAGGYDWSIRLSSNPGVVLQSGNTASTVLNVSGLTAGTGYILYVNSNCGGELSNSISVSTTTANANSAACGQYSASYFNPDPGAAQVTGFQYFNCANQYVALNVFNSSSVFFCAAQTAPGVPVGINVPPFVTYTYVGLC